MNLKRRDVHGLMGGMIINMLNDMKVGIPLAVLSKIATQGMNQGAINQSSMPILLRVRLWKINMPQGETNGFSKKC